MNIDPLPFQTTMIEERKDPSGAVKPIVSDSFLSFLDRLRASAIDDDSRIDALELRAADISEVVGDGGMGPGFRNALADGGFEVWDGSRNLTLPAGAGYTGCTMWSFQSAVGFASFTVSRQAGIVTGSQYCLRYQRTAAAVAVNQQLLVYDMETVNSIPYQGKQIIVSFTARAGANYSNAGSTLTSIIVTGTGVDQARRNVPYTGEVQTNQVNVLTTTAQRFTMSITVPANATQIGILFSYIPVGVAGAADYYEIDNVQVEASSYATNFEVLPWDVTRLRVLRYFWKTFPYDTAPAFTAGTANSMTFWQCVGPAIATGCTVSLPVQMRIAPTLATFNPAAANNQIRDNSGALDWTGIATVAGTACIAIAGFTPAGSVVGHISAVHVTADARI